MNASIGGWANAINVRAAELIPAVPAKMSAIRPMQNPQSSAAERDIPMGNVMTMNVVLGVLLMVFGTVFMGPMVDLLGIYPSTDEVGG